MSQAQWEISCTCDLPRFGGSRKGDSQLHNLSKNSVLTSPPYSEHITGPITRKKISKRKYSFNLSRVGVLVLDFTLKPQARLQPRTFLRPTFERKLHNPLHLNWASVPNQPGRGITVGDFHEEAVAIWVRLVDCDAHIGFALKILALFAWCLCWKCRWLWEKMRGKGKWRGRERSGSFVGYEAQWITST